MFRKTFLEINLDNLKHNYDVFVNNTGKKMMGIVKANAYGAIDYKIAKYLEKMGTDFFGVSSIEEALRLRKHGITSNILIMSYVNDLDMVKENDLSIIIPSKSFVKKNINNLKDVRVHIKVNTGLNRLGIFPDEAKETLNDLLKAGALVEGIMTHYACFDDVDYTYRQYYLFKEIYESLDYEFKYVHTAATDAAFYLEDEISNYVRIGLGLFGYANIEHNWDLKPCISLKAEVIECKQVNAGDGVSYNHHYISDGKGYILTVAIGYADGVDRALENAKVFVGDEECTIVGTICMDLMMVLASKPHEEGELVEIIGEHYSVERRKEEIGTCCCKILTSIAERVSRIYTKNNEVVDSADFYKKP